MSGDLARTEEQLERDREDGLHLGGQLYVSLRGRTVADAAFGEARPGESMTRDHLMLWLSSGKPVTAVAVALLWESGDVGLDDPVAEHLPEFGVRGKQSVTLRHLLTHTGGVRALGLGWPERPWHEILQRVCEMRLEPRWVPGRKAGYHLTSSWFVLGEVIRRLSGEPYPDHVRRTIFQPLGMDDCWIGMPGPVYRRLEARIAPMYDVEGGRTELEWTDELHLTRPSPGGNGIGPLGQLGRFYEMLLGGGRLDGNRLLAPQTVEAMTARQRVGLFDHTFRRKLDWGLGFVLDSRHYGEEVPPYGYGEHASSRVFGHSGYRSSTAFADPEFGLVVALAVNGLPAGRAHRARFHRLATAIYEDLGLAGG